MVPRLRLSRPLRVLPRGCIATTDGGLLIVPSHDIDRIDPCPKRHCDHVRRHGNGLLKTRPCPPQPPLWDARCALDPRASMSSGSRQGHGRTTAPSCPIKSLHRFTARRNATGQDTPRKGTLPTKTRRRATFDCRSACPDSRSCMSSCQTSGGDHTLCTRKILGPLRSVKSSHPSCFWLSCLGHKDFVGKGGG